MKIVHISTSDLNGGAAIAAYRIHTSQRKIGINSKLLVQKKLSKNPFVVSLVQNQVDQIRYLGRTLADELSIRLLTNKERGRFTFPYFGYDITKNKSLREADIINLHWINGGFLSFNSLNKLQLLNKPIVWTLHDMWVFTGGCHYNLDCQNFLNQCGNCPSLKLSGWKDFSYKIFYKKKHLLDNLKITFVTCSEWLADVAKNSVLLKGKNIISIANPLNLNVFKPMEKNKAREYMGLDTNKFILLIGAMNLTDKRKGFHYLINALQYLNEKFDDIYSKIEILTFGKYDKKLESEIPFKITQTGTVKNEERLVMIYNSADIYVAPSVQDNLPNTVVESIACGTPVVAFNVGGIPEIVDHLKSGFLANPGSYKSLAGGIVKLMENSVLLKEMRSACREKAESDFDESKIIYKYLNLYDEIIQ